MVTDYSVIIEGPLGRREITKAEADTGFRLGPGERVVGHTPTQQQVGDARAFHEMEQAFEAEGLLLGDAIAMATKAVGFEPCPSCTRRQQWLNEFHRKGKQFVKDLVKDLGYNPPARD